MEIQRRIMGYDLARALAVFGMVVVNFKVVMGASAAGPEWLVALAGLFDGRAAATFVVLAGVGVSLMSRRARLAGGADRVTRTANVRRRLLHRAGFLFFIGLLYTPLWPADILHFYGVYLTVAAFLLAASERRLWLLASGAAALFVVMLGIFDYERGWDWETLSYSDLWAVDGMIRHLFFNGFHPVLPWLGFLLVGMVLGRQDMAAPRVRRAWLIGGASAVVMAETWSLVLIEILAAGTQVPLDELRVIFSTEPMPPLPLYLLAGAGTAVALIAVCVEIAEEFSQARWLKPLVATGQLALTLYVAHVVLGMVGLDVLGRLENQSLGFALASAAGFNALAVGFSYCWRRRFERGPLEWVMRRVAG